MRHEDGRGIYEIVTSSLTTPPCQYGVLEYRDDESFSYYTRQVDMEKWARRHQSTDENLINFNTYSKTALKNIFYNQAVLILEYTSAMAFFCSSVSFTNRSPFSSCLEFFIAS